MENPSPFASHLGTNYAANGEEIAQITELLAGPTSKLGELQKEIDRAKSRYEGLFEQHLELSREIESHRALMAPIRRLPVDVIQEIFLQCLPTKHNAVISDHECPILLTRICSGWRSIAINTAALWSSIHIPIPSDTVPGYYPPVSWGNPAEQPQNFPEACAIAERRAMAIRTWLQRSGGCVLDISLYDREYSTSAQIYDLILDALIPFCSRWGSLACETPARSLMRIVTIPASQLPRLHTLTVCGTSAHGVFPPTPVLSPSGTAFWADSGVVDAPNLRAISYNNITEDFASFPLRWEQLTSITLHGIAWHTAEALSTPRVASLLAKCPRLRYCRLQIASPRLDNDLQDSNTEVRPSVVPTAIALPQLRSLNIHAGRAPLAQLFDALDVPALARLEVHTSIPAGAPLLALLRRVAPTLRELTLDSSAFTRDDFFACLRACGALDELTLRRNYYPSQPAWTPPPATHVHLGHGGGGWGAPDGESEPRTVLVLNDAFLRRVLAPVVATCLGEDVLVPRLTRFTCHTAAHFSDACVLEMLKARSASAAAGGPDAVAKLARVDIAFGRPQQQPMLAELEKLAKEGIDCRLTYSPAIPSTKHLPTDGIADFYPPSMPWGPHVF